MLSLKTSIRLKMFLEDLCTDILIFIKLFVYNIYCYMDSFCKNILPASYVNKDIDNEIVLITGAGK
jgi:hypothetical protein